jgi:ParB family chromosome partitioning protein
MAEEAHRSRLGRGLAALIGDVADEDTAIDTVRGRRQVPIEFLRANPRNPRKQYPEEELEELAASIREKGILQPILVRAVPGVPDSYEIVAGERRWRAAQRAGLHEVPILPMQLDDREALEIAIVENVQRTDLNPLEEAAGYESLTHQFNYGPADLARVVGKSRSHVANTIRLLKLPKSVQAYVLEGKLSAGHARALLGHDDPEAIAKAIIEKGLSVREVEALVQDSAAAHGRPARQRPRRAKDADTAALEKRLSDALGLVVQINHRGGRGELRIRYKTLDQLDMISRRLGARG